MRRLDRSRTWATRFPLLPAALIGLLAAGTSAGAAVPAELSIRGDLTGFVTVYDRAEPSPLNPGNAFARFPSYRTEGWVRPDFGLEMGQVSARVEPRFTVGRSVPEQAGSNEAELLLHAWSIRYTDTSWAVSAGRQLILWGPSQFSSPSNPFFASNNQTNPFLELPGRDFVTVDIFGSSWTASLMTNVGRGRDEVGYPTFKPIHALRLGYVGADFAVDGIAAWRDGRSRVGMYGQWTASDALLLYADWALSESSPALYPRRTGGALGWGFAGDGGGWRFDGLAGMSHTFANGHSVYLEYRHQQAGYSRSQTRDYFQLAQAAAAGLHSGNGSTITEAATLIGRAADPHLRGLGRNYLHTQLLLREVASDLTLNLLTTVNLNDGGAQIAGIVDYDIGNNWRLSANIVMNSGQIESEFSRYIRSIYFVGMKFFF